MDLKTGGDLRYYLRKRKIFEEIDVVFYIACISSALTHIHSKNMIHRDIKPGDMILKYHIIKLIMYHFDIKIINLLYLYYVENIILDEQGYPHLADFGVAHVQSTEDATYLVSTLASGTKQYLAPEVFCRAHIHGPESDFWSLGVVAYELLYSHRPFDKHCSVQFITYLEGCLGLKKKQLNEVFLKGGKVSNGSTVTSGENDSVIHQSDSPGQTSSGNTLNDSPIRNIIPLPPVSHHNGNNSYLNQRNVTSGSLTNESHTGVAHFLPHIINSQQNNSINSFCSSVGYTSLHTNEGIHINQNKNGRLQIHDKLVENEELHSVDKSTEVGTTEESLPKINMKVPLIQKHHIFEKINDSSTLAKGICCIEESMYSIAFEKPSEKPVTHLLPIISPNKNTSKSTKHDESLEHHTIEHKHISLPAGDHWLVKETENLPKELRVTIPHWNIVEEKLSNDCIRFMRSILDIRPSHRLSSRDIVNIEKHPWLVNYNMNNWSELHSRKFKPNFRPGKYFMIDMFGDSFQQVSLAGNALNRDHIIEGKHEDQLTDHQNKVFEQFEFTSTLFEEILNK